MKGEVRRPNALLVVAALWLMALGVAGVGVLADRGSRGAGPEATVAAYASAVERSDLEAALSQLVPATREPSRSWVAWQMGNRYHILESAVRERPLAERLIGGKGTSATVVLMVEVEGKGNPSWRAVVDVPTRLVDGAWLLEKPPLQGL